MSIHGIARRKTVNGTATPTTAPIYVDSDDNILKYIPAGSGTTEVNIADGVNGLVANAGSHLVLATDTVLSKQVKLNSITDVTTTSGDLISFQSNPGAGVAGSQSIYGGQISPRVNSGVALSGSGSVIGLHVSPYLKGTATGTIAGDVRGIQIELVTDDAGTRTISGNVSGLRIRAAFSATTITGKFSAIRVEFPETQTNSKTYDALMELTGTVGTGTATAWTNAAVTSTTAAGCLGILVNGTKRYINLFSGTPS